MDAKTKKYIAAQSKLIAAAALDKNGKPLELPQFPNVYIETLAEQIKKLILENVMIQARLDFANKKIEIGANYEKTCQDLDKARAIYEGEDATKQ